MGCPASLHRNVKHANPKKPPQLPHHPVLYCIGGALCLARLRFPPTAPARRPGVRRVHDCHRCRGAARDHDDAIEGALIVTDVDPVKFGLLIGQVKTLEAQVEDLQKDVKELLALANRSHGGIFAGMAIASALGGLGTWLINHLVK